jgi:processive 1,2-diacylglycerol beta-glucosyltransferase
MEQRKKFLLLYVTYLSGHHKACVSIEKAINKISPLAEVKTIDAFNYTNPILNKIVHKTYMSILKRKPEVWEYLYDNPNVVRNTQRLRGLIHKYNSRKLKVLIDEFKPQVICCTQAFPCGMVADFKKTFGFNIPLIGVLTDYVAHSYWYYNNVNLYIVPDESTMSHMIENGIDKEKIRIYGIPIDLEFSDSKDKNKISKSYGFDIKKPIILIMGGGRGFGLIPQIVNLLLKLELGLQIVVVAGLNKKVYRYFARRLKKINKSEKRLWLFGYTESIPNLMTVSSLLISKPGGLTTAEALTKGLPMLILNPLPGQEKSNTDFLLKIGAAVKVERFTDVPIMVKELFSNSGKLKKMQNQALKYGHPDSASKTASEIIKLTENDNI